MRALRGKHGLLQFVSNEEHKLFNKINVVEFMDISNLDERSRSLAEGLYQKNIINKIRKDDRLGYIAYKKQD